MKLELMWINSVMKRRQEGLETPSAECPPIECGQSDGATGALYRKTEVTVSDRTLASIGPVRLVNRSCKDASVGL